MINRFLKLTDATNIYAIGYDADECQLGVVFTTATDQVYLYENVPSRLFADLVNAESMGSFFAKNIKSAPKLYPFKKSLLSDLVK